MIAYYLFFGAEIRAGHTRLADSDFTGDHRAGDHLAAGAGGVVPQAHGRG